MNRKASRKAVWISILLLAAAGPGRADSPLLPMECGVLRNAYGPFDYRNPENAEKIRKVTDFHFNSDVENLRRGLSSKVGADLNYTLRAVPNHHRALMSMTRLGLRDKKSTPVGAGYSVQCFLMRAEAFRPDDAMVKVIFGHYLLKQGQRAQAISKLDEAYAANSSSVNVSYNLGLAYVDAGEYEKALINAHKAYLGGFPLPGLRDKLKRVGHWKEPAPLPQAVRDEATGKEIDTGAEGRTPKTPVE